MNVRCATPLLAILIAALVAVVGCAGAAAEQAAFKKVREKGGKIELRGSGPEVSFSHLKIVDDDLACLEGLPRIHELTLENVEITDAGLEHLHKVGRIDSIKLIKTEITEDGVRKLKAKFPECDFTRR